MVRNLEWSPNESYLTKLERLAFALVRTRPTKESCDTNIRRSRNIWVEKCKGLAGPFAIASLVAIPYIAENSSGPIILASLLLAAVDASLTVWCYTDFEIHHGHCNGDLFTCMFNCIGEFPAFLVGWWWISAMSSGFAACARTLSSIMDSVTGRHVETLMENTIGSFTPLGSPMDIMSLGVCTVPAIMCSLGMEDSNFLRSAIFGLTSTTTLSIFGYALATHHLFPTTEAVSSITPDGNLYAKVFSGAALACVGFLGLYTVSKPDNVTLTQHKHFHVSKRFSLTGCVVASCAFLMYFIESSVINKVQQTPSLWDGDPPLLWPLEGGWRLIVASLGIAALSLTTFEFLIPLSLMVTRMANDGLLYRKLKSQEEPSQSQWSSTTPLIFGGICAMQAMLIDTKVLLGLASSSLLCIHILVCSSMIALRYQMKPAVPPSHKRTGHTQTRPKLRARTLVPHPSNQNHNHNHTCSVSGSGEGSGSDGLSAECQFTGAGTSQSQSVTASGSGSGSGSGGHGHGHGHPRQTRRLLAVSFLKSGLGASTSKPREVMHEIDVCRRPRECGVGAGQDETTGTSSSERAYLMEMEMEMEDVQTQMIPDSSRQNRRESASEFSLGSNVSGYESDCEQHSEGSDDTDIDAVVTEYQEEVRVATLNGAMPMFPTPATGRRVALSLLALIPCCLAMASSLNRSPTGQFTGIMLGVSSALLTFLLLVVISRQPQRQRRRGSKVTNTNTNTNKTTPNQNQNNQNNQNGPNSGGNPTSISELESSATAFFEYSVIPWVPAGAVFLHCCLLLQALELAATPFAFWLAIGLIIYFSYSVTKSVAAAPSFTSSIPRERIRLSGTPRSRQSLTLMSTVVCGNDPSTATTSTSTSEPYPQIDTVLLA